LPAAARADTRVALVIGNSDYRNVTRLQNPRSDALLMATTLRQLGFKLIGDNAQLDLEKAGLDSAIQKFGASLRGADVALFYYAGHGVQVGGSNYLVPVEANPTREADVDFQMVDVNVVLRQMEGTKLNLVVLDACRNNPFGGRGLRATGGGLAQMRAPEGTLISFATQPGNVALDGEGNSPYTRALAATLRKPGLDIFQTFNEVGLAVKRSTAGSQQPWVSSSPIDGDFYFVAPPPPTATPPGASADEATQAWAATRDTTSLAVIDSFIQQYGSSIYGPFARARREELSKNHIALDVPKPATSAARPMTPRLSKNDVVKSFEPFVQIIDQIEKNYVEQRDERSLYVAASKAMQRAFPSAQQVSSSGQAEPRSVGTGDSAGDLDSVYAMALASMNAQSSSGEDQHIVEVAINGALAALDPHSSYLNAAAFRDMQVQNRGTFGGVGLQVNMIDGLLKVMTPIDGTPGARAGILSNDVIMSIDDTPVQGLTLRQATEKLRGPVGSPVKLRIVRQNQESPFDVTIVRDTVRVPGVRWRIEGGDIGYIRIAKFNEQTDESFKQAVSELGRQSSNDNLRGYVIDLRNNSGGLMNQVVLVADDLLERGDIASTRGRKPENTQRFSAKPGDIVKGKRIVVLINGGTASGAEILAGGLQDDKRATIVGTRSFGDGLIQTIFPLGDDRGAVRLTTTRYYTPSGASIQARGIVPDVEVLQDEPEGAKKSPSGEATLTRHLPGQGVEQVASQSYVPPNPKDDKALATALNLLHSGGRAHRR
jgi:carboxyl-terminal processing protease